MGRPSEVNGSSARRPSPCDWVAVVGETSNSSLPIESQGDDDHPMVTRTAAQTCASRTNGARSNGPTTDEGKSRSALNHVRHGVRARRVLLPHESVEDYLAEAERWVESLRPVTDAETEVVLDIVDLRVRLERIENAERKLTQAAVAKAMLNVKEAQRLKVESNAAKGLMAMRSVLDRSDSLKRDDLDGLLPAIREVLALAQGAEALHENLVPGLLELDDVVAELVTTTGPEIPTALLSSLSRHAASVEADLRSRQDVDEQLLKKVEVELMQRATPKNDVEGKRLDAYRRQLGRRLSAQLDLFEQLRRLRPGPASGSFERPVLVNLRPAPGASPALAHS